jgi:sugar/nucleoside kinase (ribokinase family)
MNYDIILLGDYFFDQIFSGLPRFPVLGEETWATKLTTTGGAMFITAVALTRLKVKVAWPAYFGNDYYSLFVHDLAAKEGVDLTLAKHVDQPYQHVTTSMPLHTERAFVTYTDPTPPDLHQHWLHSLEKCQFKHVHIGGYMSEPELCQVVEIARAQGATVSMDAQDGEYLLDPPACRKTLSQVDVFMPNTREAMLITETTTPKSALGALADLVKVAVIKDGANGAWGGEKDQTIFAPAMKIGPAIDTTGAGDCFNAGFLMGYIVAKASLEESLSYGNICGGLSVGGVGGATTAPTYEELMTIYQQNTQE